MWPPDLNRVPAIFRTFIDPIVAQIDAIRPVDGKGIKVVDAVGGKGRSVNFFGATIGGGSGITGTKPFQILDASNEDDGTQIEVFESTLAGGASAELGFFPGAQYILPVSGAGVLYGVITIDVGIAGASGGAAGAGSTSPTSGSSLTTGGLTAGVLTSGGLTTGGLTTGGLTIGGLTSGGL